MHKQSCNGSANFLGYDNKNYLFNQSFHHHGFVRWCVLSLIKKQNSSFSLVYISLQPLNLRI